MHVDDHVVVGAARVGDEGHGVAGEGLDGDLGGRQDRQAVGGAGDGVIEQALDVDDVSALVLVVGPEQEARGRGAKNAWAIVMGRDAWRRG